MMLMIAAGLMLGTPAAPAPAADAAHRVRMDHRGQRVDVTYRSDVTIAHKQVGAVGAPGRPAALRCAWTASVDVHREARHAAGHVVARTIGAATPLTGSRPGWCDAQRDAIARDVAARSDKVRDHMLAIAERDRSRLVAELDAAHDTARS